MERKKAILEKTELEALLKRVNQWGYPSRPPPAPLPEEASQPPSQSAVENFDNVVQLFPDDDMNQCPPGW